MLGLVLLVLVVILLIAGLYCLMKAAAKSAVRDIMDEMNLKKMEEEERKQKEEAVEP